MTADTTTPRVAWVNIQPAPYFFPLFEALRDSGRLDIHFFFSTMKAEQPWMLGRHEQLIAPESRGRSFQWRRYSLNPAVVRAIMRDRWDAVVISGYTNPTMLAAILICIVRRIPFVMQADSQLVKRRRWHRRVLKRLFLFPVLRRCRAAMGVGVSAKAYWEHIGVPAEHVFIVGLTSHLDAFRDRVTEAAARRSQVRKELGIAEGAVTGIFVGRLEEIKQMDLVLDGLDRTAAERRPHLLIVGDGVERAGLEATARGRSLPVTFAGFRQNDELPDLYSAADFFFLASRTEAWGIVVAEAMVFGLPLVLAEQVGASRDLLQENRNGFLVHEPSPAAWSEALSRFTQQGIDLAAMGERSREIISGWTCEESVKQFFKAMEVALAGSQRRLAEVSLSTRESVG